MVLISLLPLLQVIEPVRTELIAPIRQATLSKDGKVGMRKQNGNPRTLNGVLLFDGAQDGNRQVDPQIAVGGGFVMHGTNHGFLIYDKSGNYLDGIPQSEFNDGIDPKMHFDIQNRRFILNLWNPWDKDKLKPVNISVSATSDPRKGWYTYPVPAPKGVDGGAIGSSRKWIGYSFPGGTERTFVMSSEPVRNGRSATVYHFAGSLGHPVVTQDATDDLLFVSLEREEVVFTFVGEGAKGTPVVKEVIRKPHTFRYFGWPPASPMKGTTAQTASGDRNPKNLVVQSGSLWFSHTVNVEGRAGVQWHQFRLDGNRVQSGLVSDPVNSFIQTSLAVNKSRDVLVGFQETGPESFISARCAWRLASDQAGSLRPTVKLVEGVAATEGGAWGDYSGSCVDGDNLTDLWTVQSFATSRGRGGTVIARINRR